MIVNVLGDWYCCLYGLFLFLCLLFYLLKLQCDRSSVFAKRFCACHLSLSALTAGLPQPVSSQYIASPQLVRPQSSSRSEMETGDRATLGIQCIWNSIYTLNSQERPQAEQKRVVGGEKVRPPYVRYTGPSLWPWTRPGTHEPTSKLWIKLQGRWSPVCRKKNRFTVTRAEERVEPTGVLEKSTSPCTLPNVHLLWL